MNMNLLAVIIKTLKDIFTPRNKKLVPVKVYANNRRNFR
jgi:hypothetical protein